MLEGLSDFEKKEIISNFSNAEKYSAGEIIYSAEDFPNAICFVVTGEAFAITNNGKKIHMNNFESGTCFGAAAVFSGGDKYVSTVIAKTNIEIIFITENQLKNMFLKYPLTSLNYIKFLSNKIRFLNTKLGVISSSSAEDTVYNYLSTLVDSEGYARIPVSMTMLSKMLGLGRASLYRSFDALEAENKIKRENNIIKVIKNEKNS